MVLRLRLSWFTVNISPHNLEYSSTTLRKTLVPRQALRGQFHFNVLSGERKVAKGKRSWKEERDLFHIVLTVFV